MKTCPTFINNHVAFWRLHPALLCGLTLLIGCGSILHLESYSLFIPLFWALYLLTMRKIPIVFLLGASMLYGAYHRPDPDPIKKGYFSIGALKPHQSPFQKNLLYQGMLQTENSSIPCSVYAPFSKKHIRANSDYVLEGVSKRIDPHHLLFKPKSWKRVKNSWSMAELRFKAKERFRKFLKEKLKRKDTASFLSSMITGDVEKRFLRFSFAKLGLQHLLAISGFHFAILILFSSFFLKMCFTSRGTLFGLFLVVNLYFIFVGSLPAVQRSYLLALLYLSAILLGRNPNPLNLLGAAMLIELLFDPLVCGSIGFQLSFLSCSGILLFYRRFERFFKPVPISDTAPMIEKHIRILSAFFRKAISLNLAVNLALLPLILYHFHTFPLLSLLYNLFFPPFVTVALFMLLSSLVVHLVAPPISGLFFSFTDFFTGEILDLSAYPPIALDYSIRVCHFPFEWVLIYLFTFLAISISIERNTSVPIRF